MRESRGKWKAIAGNYMHPFEGESCQATILAVLRGSRLWWESRRSIRWQGSYPDECNQNSCRPCTASNKPAQAGELEPGRASPGAVAGVVVLSHLSATTRIFWSRAVIGCFLNKRALDWVIKGMSWHRQRQTGLTGRVPSLTGIHLI